MYQNIDQKDKDYFACMQFSCKYNFCHPKSGKCFLLLVLQKCGENSEKGYVKCCKNYWQMIKSIAFWYTLH